MSREHRDPNSELFDHYGEEYEALVSRGAGLSGEDADYFTQNKLEQILSLFAGGPAPGHIIDIGCGVGLLTECLGRALPSTRVTGLDVSTKSLERAASRCAELGNVAFWPYDGTLFPEEVEGADLAIIANVLHHVEIEARPPLLQMVARRALLPGGRVVVFEHNPYNPLTRLVVRLCPFDRDARLLTFGKTKALMREAELHVQPPHYIVFFPHFLRGLRGLEPYMGWLPLGAQYMLVAQRPPS